MKKVINFETSKGRVFVPVNVNHIFNKKRNLMFRKNGIIFFRTLMIA